MLDLAQIEGAQPALNRRSTQTHLLHFKELTNKLFFNFFKNPKGLALSTIHTTSSQKKQKATIYRYPLSPQPKIKQTADNQIKDWHSLKNPPFGQPSGPKWTFKVDQSGPNHDQPSPTSRKEKNRPHPNSDPIQDIQFRTPTFFASPSYSNFGHPPFFQFRTPTFFASPSYSNFGHPPFSPVPVMDTHQIPVGTRQIGTPTKSAGQMANWDTHQIGSGKLGHPPNRQGKVGHPPNRQGKWQIGTPTKSAGQSGTPTVFTSAWVFDRRNSV
ncbi:hypothetical protein APED_06130 [Acanthopleuribacter pedis]